MSSFRNVKTPYYNARVIPAIAAFNLISAIIVLGLSATYGKQLAAAPLDDSGVKYWGYHRWSNAYFVFNYGFLPVVTIFYGLIDLILHFRGLLHPVYALVASVLFSLGWAFLAGFWTQCDSSQGMENGSFDYCYSALVEQGGGIGWYVGVSEPLANAKLAFAWVIAILYMVYVGFAAVAVHKRRMQRKQLTRLTDEKELASQTRV